MLRRLLSRVPADPPVGGIFRWSSKDGSYGVLKVLAVDEAAIHVRLHSNRFAEPPIELPHGLELIGLGPDHRERRQRGEPAEIPANLGIGHFPQSREAFRRTPGLELIAVVPVAPTELEGYELWREGGGGVFT
jgi:hypothetical protein